MASQVAAIHGGDVSGRQRLQGFGVIPVVEMPAMARQYVQCGEHLPCALQHPGNLQIAEVVGRQIGQQRQADIGGRRAPCHYQRWMLTDVVRWQPVILGAHIGFKERPGATRQPAQKYQLGCGQVGIARRRRASQPRHDRRRGQPQQKKRRRYPQRCRLHARQQCSDHDRRQCCRPHAVQLGLHAGAQAALHFAGRVPLQQVPAREQQPPQRARDRGQAEERLVRQARQIDRRAQQLAQGGSADLHQVSLQRHVDRHGEHIAQSR
ncbi:hypothetical protein D3C71_1133500 [compost metagenome]